MANPQFLIDVIRHYDGEVKEGISKAVRCFMHRDAHRSAVMTTVGNNEGLYFCHTCGKGGDGYNLIMIMEGCDFVTAKQRATAISSSSGGDLPRKSRSTDQGLLSKSRVQRPNSSRLSTRNRPSRLR
jgi:DNA primase